MSQLHVCGDDQNIAGTFVCRPTC